VQCKCRHVTGSNQRAAFSSGYVNTVIFTFMYFFLGWGETTAECSVMFKLSLWWTAAWTQFLSRDTLVLRTEWRTLSSVASSSPCLSLSCCQLNKQNFLSPRLFCTFPNHFLAIVWQQYIFLSVVTVAGYSVVYRQLLGFTKPLIQLQCEIRHYITSTACTYHGPRHSSSG
jgi:hypothetical protein